MYCNKCGAENPSDANFCRNCGIRISNVDTANLTPNSKYDISIIDKYPEYKFDAASLLLNSSSLKFNIGPIGWPIFRNLLRTIDYIQRVNYAWIRPHYIFFIKDNKFGLINVWNSFYVQIDAEYDYMKWKEKNKYLEVERNGFNYVVDINGNKV